MNRFDGEDWTVLIIFIAVLVLIILTAIQNNYGETLY